MSRQRSDFGNIRKLPSGRWQARYRDRSGVARTAPTTFPTRGDASRYLAGVRADLDRGNWFDPNAGRTKVKAYADSWLKTRRVRGGPLAPRTRELYRWQLDRHILPALGDVELRHLDPATVRTWYGNMTSKTGPGAITAAKCYRLLRTICETAVFEEELPRNPCTIPGAGQERSPARPALSVPEVYALADSVGDRWRALVLLAAFTGLRFGELAGLRRRHVNLLHGVVEVRESVSYLAGGVRHVGPPKSEAGRRTVAVPPHIVGELRDHVDRYAEAGPDGLIFVGPKGGPLRNATFSRSVWRPALAANGLSGVHFHDLRGFAATLAAISGATTAELMARIGHSTPDMALRYQRATADRDAALAKALSAHVERAVIPMPRRGLLAYPDDGISAHLDEGGERSSVWSVPDLQEQNGDRRTGERAAPG